MKPKIADPKEQTRARDEVNRAIDTLVVRAERGEPISTKRWEAKLRESLAEWDIVTRTRYLVQERNRGEEYIYIDAEVRWDSFSYMAQHAGRVIAVPWEGAVFHRVVRVKLPKAPKWSPDMSARDFAAHMQRKRAARGG